MGGVSVGNEIMRQRSWDYRPAKAVSKFALTSRVMNAILPLIRR
jgi:hypothetical protein